MKHREKSSPSKIPKRLQPEALQKRAEDALLTLQTVLIRSIQHGIMNSGQSSALNTVLCDLDLTLQVAFPPGPQTSVSEARLPFWSEGEETGMDGFLILQPSSEGR